MDNDDEPIGRVLARREVLALFGGAGLALIMGCESDDGPAATTAADADGASTATLVPTASTGTASATASATLSGTATTGASVAVPACVAVPELTEGPYFVDEGLNRADIVEGEAGIPLELTVNVSHVASDACALLSGALVDIWHCNAEGEYSDVTDQAQGFNTVGETFLRGQLETDENGQVTFRTIYPGWYPGRAVHIHFKIRVAAADGSTHDFTSQFFFDDDLSDELFAEAPYAKSGTRTRNDTDNIYGSGGSQLLLDLEADGSGGFTSAFDLGLQI